MKLRTLCAIGVMGAFCACADTDMVQLNTQEPETLSAYDYLKGYDVLKSYSSNIGVIMDAGSLTDGSMNYRIGVSNFGEVVPGSTFAHATAIKANGTVDSTGIAKIATAAQKAGVRLLGTPLVWHKQQNTTYLTSQLSANVIRPEGDDGGYCLKMTNNTLSSNPNDEQVAYTFARTPRVEPGITYKLKMMVRGTVEGTIRVQTYANGRGSRFSPDITVTKDWTKVEATNSMATGIRGLTSILFCLGQYVGTLYVDDIEIVEYNTRTQKEVGKNLNTTNTNLDDAEQTAKSIAVQTDTNGTLEDVGCSALGEGYDALATYVEKTDAEKQAIVKAEMQKYISGVMTAAGSATDDWIVVKEPLTEDDGDVSCFYWQSYLGSTGYAVAALSEAASHTTGKLYIEESGLDEDLDKCARFVSYASTIESEGARVDGLAVTISADTELTSVTNVNEMFRRLAASGRMVRISDLQVSIGGLTTDEVTEEQLKQQASLIGDIVKAYMDNVPAAQRGGITLHQILDGTQPLGLWSSDYSRKHAYGSVCAALQNQ